MSQPPAPPPPPPSSEPPPAPSSDPRLPPPSSDPRLAAPPSWWGLRGLALALTVLLVGQAVLLIAHTGGLLQRIGLLTDVATDGGGQAALERSDAFMFPLYLVLIATAFVTAVVWVIWQFGHARNGRALGATGSLTSPGWAIGGWFIPLAQFVLGPRQLLASARVPRRSAPPPRTLVVVWALAFAAYSIGNRIAGQLAPSAATPQEEFVEQFVLSDQVEALTNVVGIVAAVLAVLVVRRFTADQEAVRPAR